MILRVFVLVLLVLLTWLVVRAAIRFIQRRDIDWTGVAAAIGFVAAAFWLRHVMGWG